MIVVDASVVAPALGDDERDGHTARLRLAGEELAAPEVVDLEVLSVWRRQMALGSLAPRRADLAIRDLREIPLRRAPHRHLVARCWQLRANLTVYDACYVALAELLQVLLLTADAKLANAPGLRCEVEVLDAGR